MHRVGTWAGTNYYNQATYNAVKNFQRSHHLPATGNVNLATWEKMGFSKKSWYSIDSYVVPLKAYAWQGRKAHIEAMINQAYKYMEKKKECIPIGKNISVFFAEISAIKIMKQGK